MRFVRLKARTVEIGSDVRSRLVTEELASGDRGIGLEANDEDGWFDGVFEVVHIDTVFIQEVVIKEIQREVILITFIGFPCEMVYKVKDLE